MLARLLLEMLTEVIDVSDGERVDPVTIARRAVGVLKHTQRDGQRVRVDALRPPAGEQLEAARHEESVRRNRREKEKGILLAEKLVQDPVVLDLEELQKQRIALRVETRQAKEARVPDGRLDCLGGSRGEDVAKDLVLHPKHVLPRPDLFEVLLFGRAFHPDCPSPPAIAAAGSFSRAASHLDFPLPRSSWLPVLRALVVFGSPCA